MSEFEWDSQKAAQHARKHGVSFQGRSRSHQGRPETKGNLADTIIRHFQPTRDDPYFVISGGKVDTNQGTSRPTRRCSRRTALASNERRSRLSGDRQAFRSLEEFT